MSGKLFTAIIAALMLAPVSSVFAEDVKAKSIIDSMLSEQLAREKATPFYLVRESRALLNNEELLLLYGRPCEIERVFTAHAKDEDRPRDEFADCEEGPTLGYTIVDLKEMEYMLGGRTAVAADQATMAMASILFDGGMDATVEIDKARGKKTVGDGSLTQGFEDMSEILKERAMDPRLFNKIQRRDSRDSWMDMKEFGKMASLLGTIKLNGRKAFVLMAGNTGVKGNTHKETLEMRKMLTDAEIWDSYGAQADYEINTVMLAVDTERLVPLAMGIWGTTMEKTGKYGTTTKTTGIAEPFQIFREDRDYFKVHGTPLYIPKTTTMAMRMKLTGMDKKQKKELEKALKDFEKMKAELDAMKQAQEAAGGVLGGFMDDQIAKMEEMVRMMEVADADNGVEEAEINLETIQKIFDGNLVGDVQTNHAAVGGELKTLVGLAYIPWAQPGKSD